MDWLLKFIVIWLSFDIIVLATVWYAVATIKPRFPGWWQRVIVADDPEYMAIDRKFRY